MAEERRGNERPRPRYLLAVISVVVDGLCISSILWPGDATQGLQAAQEFDVDLLRSLEVSGVIVVEVSRMERRVGAI